MQITIKLKVTYVNKHRPICPLPTTMYPPRILALLYETLFFHPFFPHPSGRWRDTLLLRGLHLLTLAVHVMDPTSKATPPNGGDAATAEGKGKGPGGVGAFGGDGGQASDVDALCGAIMKPIVLPPLPELPAASREDGHGGGDDAQGVRREEDKEET